MRFFFALYIKILLFTLKEALDYSNLWNWVILKDVLRTRILERLYWKGLTGDNDHGKLTLSAEVVSDIWSFEVG